MRLVVTLVRRNTLKPMESPKDKRDPDEPESQAQGSEKLPERVGEAASERQPASSHPPADASETALIRPTALQLYLSKIGRYPVLSPEEEHKLAVQYLEEDDREAAYKLVTSNLRLVVKIALEFQRTWMNNLLDLIQEGNVGLMQAVKKFDPYRGIRLSSYASFWIKAYILKFILDNWRLVKIGKTQAERKLFYNLYKEKEKLHQLGYDPGPKLIAQRLNVKEEEVIRMDQRLGSWEVSLEKPIKEDASSKSIRDLLPGTTTPQDERLGDEQLRTLVEEKLQLQFGGRGIHAGCGVIMKRPPAHLLTRIDQIEKPVGIGVHLPDYVAGVDVESDIAGELIVGAHGPHGFGTVVDLQRLPPPRA